MKTKVVSIALLFALTSPAHALIPASGMWWNPSLSGSGFEIELQGRTMTLATYAYGASGAPLWYLAAGNYDEQTRTFTGTGNTFSGGQCLGCGYTSPVSAPAGDFSVTFTDSEHATVTFPGGSYTIEHFAYGYASKLDYLLGEWVFTATGPLPADDPEGGTQWIVFDTHASGGDGTPILTGHGDGNTAIAVAAYDASTDTFRVTIDLVTSDASLPSEVQYLLSGNDRMMTGDILPVFSPPLPIKVAAFRWSY